MPVNQLYVYIVYSVFVSTQLRERIILNSEMEDAKVNFNSAVERSPLELERQGMSRVLRNENVKAGIGTRFAYSAKTLHHFYLMPKCYLF